MSVLQVNFYKDMLLFEWVNKNFKKMSKITKLEINIPKIMVKEKRFRKTILKVIEIGPLTSSQEILSKK